MLLGAQPGKGRVGHGGEVGKAVCAEVDEGSIGDGLGPGRLGPAKGAGPGARSRKDALWCGTKNMTYPPSGKGLHCIQTTSPSYQGKPRQHFWEERGTVSLLSRASLNLSPPAGCGQAEGAHFPVWPALAPLCSGLGPRQREGRHVLPIALGLSQSLLMPFSRTPMGGHCGGGGLWPAWRETPTPRQALVWMVQRCCGWSWKRNGQGQPRGPFCKVSLRK